jgi:hypothetical protein
MGKNLAQADGKCGNRLFRDSRNSFGIRLLYLYKIREAAQRALVDLYACAINLFEQNGDLP